MQVDAALYDHETETRTWTLIDVMPAVEGVEEPLPVGFSNSNALVADSADNFCFVAPDLQGGEGKIGGLKVLVKRGCT